MAVTFTPNIGLAKVTESEVAENWVNSSQLQDDNNTIIETETDIALTSYTPSFIAQTTNPSVGAGDVVGEYQDINGFVQGHFIIRFIDPGVAVGSGEYGISLPFPADGSFHVVGTALSNGAGLLSCIGEGYVWDNNVVDGSGTVAIDVVTVAGVSYARLITETFAGKTSAIFRNAMPFTVVNGDRLTANFFYKRT